MKESKERNHTGKALRELPLKQEGRRSPDSGSGWFKQKTKAYSFYDIFRVGRAQSFGAIMHSGGVLVLPELLLPLMGQMSHCHLKGVLFYADKGNSAGHFTTIICHLECAPYLGKSLIIFLDQSKLLSYLSDLILSNFLVFLLTPLS